ncbi:MAG: PSD1 and planctomycete cytochrome C domain-containing protein, partial [Chthoniobacteraceae bacterium]
RAAALAPAKSGDVAIVPGKAEESQLVERIFSNDDDDQMPPPKLKKQLTEEQKDILKRWVAAGANYDPHWAFIKPERPTAPSVADPSFPVRNAIDAFVREKLRSENLTPSLEADRATLLRRVSYDLIGLPPSPDEVATFVNDPSPDAYEKQVDRLLASPAYGERWARRWLDLARYSDTNGYEKDRERSIWPYRDWVIRALNEDMPFDQFTIEQIAGDLLPDATPDQIVATGFHRNTMLNEEGGIDPLEFRYHAVVDRLRTTGKTWLGLTVECAQCHTHKFDPITHREYFQMFAFLNNADEPDYDLPDLKADELERSNRAKAKELIAKLAEQWPIDEVNPGAPVNDPQPIDVRRREMIAHRFAKWLDRERALTAAWQTLIPTSATSNLPLLTPQDDGSIFVSGDITKSDIYQLRFANVPKGITAIRLEALPDERLSGHGPGLAYYEGPKGDFFLGEFQLSADGQPVKFSQATESYAKNNFGSNPATAAKAIDGDPQSGWSCAGRPGEAQQAVFIPDAPIRAEQLDLQMLFGRHYACSLGRFRISVSTDQCKLVARAFSPEIEKLLLLSDHELSAEQRGQLREAFLLGAPELAARTEAIRELLKPVPRTTTLVMRERPPQNPRPTFIHHRGEFLQSTDPVEAGVPAVLNPLPEDAPRNRLGLARWLVARENPLTARVAVNRAWAAFFGRGLVATMDDFGYQGDPPSHPALLDWLAVEFMERGWSQKHLHRLMVTSTAYRQASRITPEMQARDPQNVLLARGPRTRLEAEMIRDGALKIAGLLTEKIGGPSVRPPQPPGVTEVAYGNPKWDASSGSDRYRRSLYTFSKRTAPFAMYAAFDAPAGDACVARRDVSDTPLQALMILNDVVFIEAAQALGRTFAAKAGDESARIRELFIRFYARSPDQDEVDRLSAFLRAQIEHFTQRDDAKNFAGEGGGDPIQCAAWTALARALFNTDEAITKG